MAKKGKIKDELIRQLTKEGERLINLAYKRREWENDTFNLHDSYCSAVYQNGQLLPETIRFLEPNLATAVKKGKKNKDMFGREWAMDTLKKYTPKSSGLDLVIMATMPYAEELEFGYSEYGARMKRYVIYSVLNDAISLAENVGGEVEDIVDPTNYNGL